MKVFVLALLCGCLVWSGFARAEGTLYRPIDCLSAPYTAANSDTQMRLRGLMANLRDALDGFPSLLVSLGQTTPDICLSGNLLTEKAFVDPEANRIVLSKDLSDGLALAVLVHELRHVDQLARDACPTIQLAMTQYAQGIFAMEADANVISLLVASTLRDDGDTAMWQALADWPMTSDIAIRFETVLTDTGDVPAAAAAAFEQWYLSEHRRELYYVASCSNYLDQQDATHALPEYRLLADDYLSRICILPDGGPYPCRAVDSLRR